MSNTAKTLDEQIEERKQQAENRKIFEKARLVAEKLGKKTSEEIDGRTGERSLTYVFNASSSLVIKCNSDEGYVRSDEDYSPGGDTVTIISNGKEVFNSYSRYADSVHTYLPGAWEKELDALHPKAERVREKQWADARREANRQKKAAEDAKRKKWGL